MVSLMYAWGPQKGKGKGKVNVDLYSALSWTHLSGAQVYDTRSEGISQKTEIMPPYMTHVIVSKIS